MMKSKNVKRILSMVMALCLTMGMLPTAAFATGDNVGPYQGYDEKGQTTDAEILTAEQSVKNTEEGKLQFSKTIKENSNDTFDITLKVTTTEELEKIPVTADAAVVLVLDVSGSMKFCSGCGSQLGNGGRGETVHWETCKFYSASHKNVTDAERRIAKAKEAAKNFVDDFAKDANGAKRMVAVVA